jgi:hypothetical protein
MNKTKQSRLKRAGWKIGSARDFLGLTSEEEAIIEMRIVLARGVKQRRMALQLSQGELAKRLGSSQSRIAKAETADVSVSLDLLVRSLLALGATRQEVGRIMARKSSASVA